MGFCDWLAKEFPEPKRDSPSDEGLLWCPLAEIPERRMKTRGGYESGQPEGAVIHYTSGQSAKTSLNWGRKQGYCYFIIDRDGIIYQSFPLNRWGYHAGKSLCPVTDRSSVSKYYVGIELASAGKLSKINDDRYKSWFGNVYKGEEVRSHPGGANIVAGSYHVFTEEQEDALIKLLCWLKKNSKSFDFNRVFGHDEICDPLGRKCDPGAALSVTMPEFRGKLVEKFLEGDYANANKRI